MTQATFMYIICALLAKKERLYNLYQRLQEQRCWPTDWFSNSANHALLTKKHKQLAECAVTDVAAAPFPLEAWDRGENNTWPWTESRVRDKQRYNVDIFMAVKRQATLSMQNILMLPNSLREETQPLEVENINDLSRLHRSHKKQAQWFLHSKICERKLAYCSTTYCRRAIRSGKQSKVL